MEALLKGISTKHATEQHKHLNRSKTQRKHYNTLIDFLLHGFNKHLHRFRYGGKEEHLNRSKTQKINRNSLKNFLLHGFGKHLLWFRCSGKVEHLNPAARLNQTANSLTTKMLQDFRQLCPWFRCQPGLEHRRMQMHSGGASCRGIHQTRNRTAQASEPELNPRNSPQFIERLSVVRF